MGTNFYNHLRLYLRLSPQAAASGKDDSYRFHYLNHLKTTEELP